MHSNLSDEDKRAFQREDSNDYSGRSICFCLLMQSVLLSHRSTSIGPFKTDDDQKESNGDDRKCVLDETLL